MEAMRSAAVIVSFSMTSFGAAFDQPQSDESP
jgi:hypothetical protein